MARKAVEAASELQAGTVAIVVAGPVTAARLGVPVGTHVAARVVPPAGVDLAPGEDVVSVEEAHETLRAWGTTPTSEEG